MNSFKLFSAWVFLSLGLACLILAMMVIPAAADDESGSSVDCSPGDYVCKTLKNPTACEGTVCISLPKCYCHWQLITPPEGSSYYVCLCQDKISS